jgi:hypothetical protein
MERRERRSGVLAQPTGLRLASGEPFLASKAIVVTAIELIKLNNINYLIGY